MTHNTKSLTIAHLTDIHMNFPSAYRLSLFIEHLNQQIADDGIDCFVLTGDISEAPLVVEHMKLIKDYVKRPCYFVCGNHDFYHGSIEMTRSKLAEAFNDKTNVCYLSATDYIGLNETTAVIGHDGWYDGVYADWFKSKLLMNDYHIIGELKPLYDKLLFAKIQELAKEGAAHVVTNVRKAMLEGDYKNIIIGTHVPPFPENSVYEGKISDSDWLPHFSSGFMGDAILELAGEFDKVNFIVLCGHSHGIAEHSPVGNVKVFTGIAKYGDPRISKIHIID